MLLMITVSAAADRFLHLEVTGIDFDKLTLPKKLVVPIALTASMPNGFPSFWYASSAIREVPLPSVYQDVNLEITTYTPS